MDGTETMQNDTQTSMGEMDYTKVWIGIGIGAAIGLGYALTHNRKKSRWSQAKDVTRRLSSHSDDVVDAGRNIIERIQYIVDEGRKVMDDASDLWNKGRKIVAR